MVNKQLIISCLLVLFMISAYSQESKINAQADASMFVNRVLNDTSDFYYVDFDLLKKKQSPALPIGIFDSGTGGLTVLDAILKFDSFNNTTQEFEFMGDGISDFSHEAFIYFGDQANMPYGNYPAMNKTDFLGELILKDALFLLGNKNYQAPGDTIWQNNKQPVKMIVIACNTATAYGMEDIEKMLLREGSKMKVVGVIDAGVRGALATFGLHEDGTAAVIATEGTVTSNGYLNAFHDQKTTSGHTGKLDFFQQPGFGIAEAIDEEPNFIDRKAKKVRTNYKGPSLTNPKWEIKTGLIHVYNFDTANHALLFEKTRGKYTEIQLNSPENYIRFHLVNLCEQLKQKPAEAPLKTLILGCTHYPYYTSFFKSFLAELYNLKINGEYHYRDVLNKTVILTDPAINTAREVYEYLSDRNLLNTSEEILSNRFFISVPDPQCTGVETDRELNFTYTYKYSRNVNHFYDTKQVPMNSRTVNQDVFQRIKDGLPQVYDMITAGED